ncbi:hypothetical protein J6590_045849 [Homalodisca vitripennis]|nr:hypothetical protein J6590_045849 [Homalodisca vitripennis]
MHDGAASRLRLEARVQWCALAGTGGSAGAQGSSADSLTFPEGGVSRVDGENLSAVLSAVSVQCKCSERHGYTRSVSRTRHLGQSQERHYRCTR